MPTKVLPCTCENKVQDAVYGHGKRVFNLAKQGSIARCTVCEREQSIAREETKKK